MSDSYYNTTRLRGQVLRMYEAKAEGQEHLVQEWFQANPTIEATPEDVGELILPDAPRHSLARVMCNLTKRGIIEKVEGKRADGQYGRPIGFWRLRHINEQQELAL